MKFGSKVKKEGLYSPITQNRRHLELIKQIRSAEKGTFTREIFEKYFYDSYRSIIVLANTKTVLNAKYAKKEVKEQIIRADQLSEYIRNVNKTSKNEAISDKDMEELAQFFLGLHKVRDVDYLARYKVQVIIEEHDKPVAEQTEILCPRCGSKMVLRKATKGANVGQEFYGCSNFPRCRGIVQY